MRDFTDFPLYHMSANLSSKKTKKNKIKKFPKPIDKLTILWYYNDVKRKEQRKLKN